MKQTEKQKADKIFFQRVDVIKATYEEEMAEVEAKYDKAYELILKEYNKKIQTIKVK